MTNAAKMTSSVLQALLPPACLALAAGTSCVPDAYPAVPDAASDAAGGGSAGGGSAGGGSAGGGSAGGGSAGGGAGGQANSPDNLLYGFDAGVEGFSLDDTAPGEPAYQNVSEGATLDWVKEPGADGQPGVLRVVAGFTAYNQLVQLETRPDSMDLSNRVLSAWVKIEAGFSPDQDAPGGGFIYVKTGPSFAWGQGAWENFYPSKLGTWQKISITVSRPQESGSGYDPTQVTAIGVEIGTGSGDNASGTPSATLAYVDLIAIVPE